MVSVLKPYTTITRNYLLCKLNQWIFHLILSRWVALLCFPSLSWNNTSASHALYLTIQYNCHPHFPWHRRYDLSCLGWHLWAPVVNTILIIILVSKYVSTQVTTEIQYWTPCSPSVLELPLDSTTCKSCHRGFCLQLCDKCQPTSS